MSMNMTPVVGAAGSIARAVTPVVKAGAVEFGKTAVQCAAALTVTVTMYGGAFAAFVAYKKWSDKRATAAAAQMAATAEAPAQPAENEESPYAGYPAAA